MERCVSLQLVLEGLVIDWMIIRVAPMMARSEQLRAPGGNAHVANVAGV
eukprot:CAMPEP_0119022644 /NCGR_PEP_ID=MMETSP1176-20130426/28451_1 /TAXON_ID=265551 /ORGANISM="Synedropsis recta cf, Strain CCMP1620" /LENGTH=48 /DNA_ID= /DNA_START= /DNA_END= /DNA_ORIENTATION=